MNKTVIKIVQSSVVTQTVLAEPTIYVLVTNVYSIHVTKIMKICGSRQSYCNTVIFTPCVFMVCRSASQSPSLNSTSDFRVNCRRLTGEQGFATVPETSRIKLKAEIEGYATEHSVLQLRGQGGLAS